MAIDSALEDFLKRFGDTDPNKKMIQNEYRAPGAIKTSQELQDDANESRGLNGWLRTGESELGKKTKDLVPFDGEVAEQTWGKDLDIPEGESSGADGVSDGEGFTKGKAAGYANLGMGAYQAALNFQGDQFDTSAEGGGPGKPGGAIAKGAADGAAAGMVFGPWGAGAGAIVGGLASTIGHSTAMKKWRKEQVKHNLALNAEETMVRQDEYSRSEGLASMANLKSLREKQLGIVT